MHALLTFILHTKHNAWFHLKKETNIKGIPPLKSKRSPVRISTCDVRKAVVKNTYPRIYGTANHEVKALLTLLLSCPVFGGHFNLLKSNAFRIKRDFVFSEPPIAKRFERIFKGKTRILKRSVPCFFPLKIR